jgi:choline dehydrogenase
MSRNNFFINWHAAATCRMHRVNDSLALVDSKARVIDVSRLRVVDASAFALLPLGHPVSTRYRLAEMISLRIVELRVSECR